MDNQNHTLKARFSGHVQGVSFRYFVKLYADELHLSGIIYNLKNGDVEMIAVGKKALLEKLLEDIQKRPGRGKIEKISAEFLEETQNFIGFSIQR